MPLTIGTAGHIDHGKTWLVRALTGKDTDRLPEEQERGISIDLGYAPLDLPDGRRLSLIDVPGHERFVRTMVAGASGIDLFLLVIDAGEGARPQTHEHLAVLRLLGVARGVVAVTKADAVDEETLALAMDEARELVPGANVVPVSAKTGAGLDELRAALTRAADSLQHSDTRQTATRLYVDRVFTLHGIGTVATGTLWSGRITAGDRLRAEPAGLDVRVRSVQVHDEPVDVADAGQRVAVALPGIERHQLHRGDALVSPGAFALSYRLDVVVQELAPIPERALVHHGTSATLARVVRVGRFAQLRLAAPVLAARGDRIVLRAGTTVGGGEVLDPAPPRHASAGRFERAERGERLVFAPVQDGGEWVFSDEWLDELPTRSIPGFPRRASRGSRPSSRGWVSSAAARSCTGPALWARSARASARPPSSRRSSASSRSGSTTGSSPVSSRIRAGWCVSATATRSRRPHTSVPARRSCPSWKQPAGSRSRGSATSSASRGSRRSSCWSASTPTVSRAASVTSAC